MFFLKIPVAIAAAALCWQLYVVWCAGKAVKAGKLDYHVHRRNAAIFIFLTVGAVAYVVWLSWFAASKTVDPVLYSFHRTCDMLLTVDLALIWFKFNGKASRWHKVHVNVFRALFVCVALSGLAVLYQM
jgi:hypothetical protein